MEPLTQEEIQEKMLEIQNWQLINNAIEKDYVFKNFAQALSFIVRIGIESEKINHHPEIFNIYNKIKIRISTHDVQALTNLDFGLAKKIDAAFLN